MGNETNLENCNKTEIDQNIMVQDDLPDDISFYRYC